MQIQKRAHFARCIGCDARLELVQLFAHDVECGGQAADLMQHVAPLDRVLANVELRWREQMRTADRDSVRYAATGERPATALDHVAFASHALRRSPTTIKCSDRIERLLLVGSLGVDRHRRTRARLPASSRP